MGLIARLAALVLLLGAAAPPGERWVTAWATAQMIPGSNALPRPGPLGRAAAHPVPDGGETPWAGPGSAAAADRPVPSAGGGAGRIVLKLPLPGPIP